MTTNSHTIDAAGKSLGRIASDAAKHLMGKTRADYTPHIFSDVKVKITNASQLRIRDKKRLSQKYQNYSGYPSGLREETLERLSARKGYGAAVRLAVTRMLPNNTMRPKRLKNLTVSE